MENLRKIYNLLLTSPAIREQFSQLTNPQDAITALIDIGEKNGIEVSPDDLKFVFEAERLSHTENLLGLDAMRWGLFSMIRVACVAAHRNKAKDINLEKVSEAILSEIVAAVAIPSSDLLETDAEERVAVTTDQTNIADKVTNLQQGCIILPLYLLDRNISSSMF